MYNHRLINIIRKIPPLFFIGRFIYRELFPQVVYIANLLKDPSYIKKNLYWYDKIKQLQIRRKSVLFADRQSEVKKFFKIDNIHLFRYYLKYGFPNSVRFKKNLDNFFIHKQENDDDLKKAYDEASFHYSLRLMLAYERYNKIIPYVDFLISEFKKPIKEFKILDYGCGISDIGLLLAFLGANVTIADLDDKKFQFAIWRFKIRNLYPEVIRIKNIKEYPKLTKSKYDLIVSTEVFEHIRDPLKLLKNLTDALRLNGFLFATRVRNEEERFSIGYVGHLKEAFEILQSDAYRKYSIEHYDRIIVTGRYSYLFKKIN